MILNRSAHNEPEYRAREFIEKYPRELNDNGVGFDEIVFAGRHVFAFEGGDLDAFARLAVASVCRAGGRPKLFVGDAWVERTHYGSDPETVAGAIVDEWVSTGRPDIEFFQGIRFRLDESFYWPS